MERLEDLDREQLLATVRRVLAEADALSSRIAAVNEIGVAVNQTLDLEVIMQVVARQAKWLLDFDHCSVCLQKDDSWQLNTLFGDEESFEADWLATENVGLALKKSQPQIIRSGSPSPFLSAYQSQIIIPLTADNTVLGTINFALKGAEGYTQDDMRIGYMLGLQLSSAIRNAHTFQQLKQTRDALQVYSRELEATNQELDAYGHTIAHDLKSPLANIMLSSELVAMMHKDQLSEQARERLTSIGTSTKQMGQMIDQLLWLAKLRHTEETLTPVDMETAARAAAFRFSHMLGAKGIKLTVEPDMPDAMGHEQWMEEVFANLINNAIKYMGEDNPAPRITIRGCRKDNIARYEVEDTGVGIAPEDQEQLFAMFTRLHTVTADGLGLGLSIVKRIIDRLGGTLGVESAPGEGSTFWFTLPFNEAIIPDV